MQYIGYIGYIRACNQLHKMAIHVKTRKSHKETAHLRIIKSIFGTRIRKEWCYDTLKTMLWGFIQVHEK
jgi:hypothetical protein